MASDAPVEYTELLDRARADAAVIGVVVFGSRAAGPYAALRSPAAGASLEG